MGTPRWEAKMENVAAKKLKTNSQKQQEKVW